ncbi:MAG: hypothetical protein Q4G33_13195 [bacterium]|nr:hypothetical protein [bacterium]
MARTAHDNTVENPTEEQYTENVDIDMNNTESVEPEPTAEADADDTANAAADTEPIAPVIKSRREVLAEKRANEVKRAKNNAIHETRLMVWEQLKSAKHERRILYSRIFSVETLNNGKVTVAVLSMEGFRVIIPCMEMYKVPPLDMSTVTDDNDRIRREKQIMTKLLGAEIPFIITNIEGDPDGEPVIIASRKEALQRMVDHNYNRRNRDGKSLINEGDTVESTVISVGRFAVWANVGGLDVSIPVYRLTHRYVEDATQMYTPGQKLNIYVGAIQYDENNRVSRISVSGKEPEIDEFRPKLKNIKSGAAFLGKITSIRQSRTDSSRTIITLFLEDIGVPAIANYTRIDALPNPPITGDTVVFSAYAVREESGTVIGSILRRV